MTESSNTMSPMQSLLRDMDESRKLCLLNQKPGQPCFKKINGITLNSAFAENRVISAINYKPRDDDLFFCAYPKSGQTWLENIVYLIKNNGQPLPSDKKLIQMYPFLEMFGAEIVELMPPPRGIKTHLSYENTPKNPNAKYIVIVRNPKDCLVSFYYHTKNFSDQYFYADGKFDDYFELFINGEVDFGDYFDHLLSWYSHRNDSNVLFLTYESVKQDPKKNILAIAKFLDKKYEDLLVDGNNNVLEEIIKHSTFSEMRKDLTRWIPNPQQAELFIRKGEIGDWRNHFSEEQSKRMNTKMQERLKDTDILSLWSNDILY